jgi:hypothetical protein
MHCANAAKLGRAVVVVPASPPGLVVARVATLEAFEPPPQPEATRTIPGTIAATRSGAADTPQRELPTSKTAVKRL